MHMSDLPNGFTGFSKRDSGFVSAGEAIRRANAEAGSACGAPAAASRAAVSGWRSDASHADGDANRTGVWGAPPTISKIDMARYLADARRLPVLVCALTDPEESDTPPAFPAGVRTALCLRGNASPAELTRKLTFCAARTPLLALDGVLLTVRCATDLGQLPLWRGILREFLETEENIRL